MRLISAGLSDVGCVRAHNEDSFLVDESRGFFVVADGMGGHAAGEVASRLCVDTVQRFLLEEAPPTRVESGSAAAERLRTAIDRASQAIQAEARRKPVLYGMGTTVVVMTVEDGTVLLAHAGDSRAYLIRDHDVVRLTSDHSWVNEQVRAGLLTEEEGESSQYKHLLTRSVGFETRVQSDTTFRPIAEGDRYLLCSDGLTNVVSDPELAQIVTENGDPEEAARALVDLARDRGAPDNVTAVLLYIID